MRILFLLCLCLGSTTGLYAQTLFGDKCLGQWQGTMYLYNQGRLKDSVHVKMTIARRPETNTWTWRTDYLSDKQPMTKDYILRLVDQEKNQYVTDEGGGLLLNDYVFGDKMYSVFETSGFYLTSSYERLDDKLIFEVTSGKKLEPAPQGVTTFTVANLQRVILKRIN